MSFKIVRTKKKKEPTRMLKRVLFFCFLIVTLYTILEFYRVWKFGGENSTLTTHVFQFYGTELICGTLIKIFEKKEESKNGMDNK